MEGGKLGLRSVLKPVLSTLLAECGRTVYAYGVLVYDNDVCTDEQPLHCRQHEGSGPFGVSGCKMWPP